MAFFEGHLPSGNCFAMGFHRLDTVLAGDVDNGSRRKAQLLPDSAIQHDCNLIAESHQSCRRCYLLPFLPATEPLDSSSLF